MKMEKGKRAFCIAALITDKDYINCDFGKVLYFFVVKFIPMKLSVVVSMYNEEKNVEPLIEQVEQALHGIDYELILVDDGSTDGTVAKIKSHANAHTKLVVFRKNFGQSTAMKAGIDQAAGKYIVTMDGDLQNDPADIPAMMAKLENEDWDVVAGRRANRQDDFVLRKFPSKIANWIIRSSTQVFLSDYGCSLRIYRSEIAKNLGLYGELHRFIPVLAALQGARMTEVDVRHHARQFGESKYGINRTYKVMVDLLLMLFFQKYLRRPMHLFGGLGLLFLVIGFLINVYLLIVKLGGSDIGGRPILILGAILLFAGIQFITIGVIMELIMRTYYESQGKKTYLIKEIFTLEPEA
jgi:glycosyltransferase involved in cell wall biosynthesis